VRQRLIRPGFFANEVLASLPPLTRLLFAGLWCIADREGRLEDRPSRIKAQCLPYDSTDPDEQLASLESSGFIIRYSVNGQKFIAIPKWHQHQWPHIKEAQSLIPEPDPSIILAWGKHSASNTTCPSGSTGSTGSTVKQTSGASAPGGSTPSSRSLAKGNGGARKGHDTQLTPYGEAWMERWGAESKPPYGEMARAVKEAEEKVGPMEAVARWRRFLAAAERAEWARPARFVQGLGQWAEGAASTIGHRMSKADQISETNKRVLAEFVAGRKA